MAEEILTVGHSNRPILEFLELLRIYSIDLLVDIRTVPRSRHNPQFNREVLPQTLNPAGIEYRHMPELGGLRRPRKDSINTAWRNASFRGYADYMQTAEFSRAVDDLVAASQGHRVAIMCAEAVPWRCHRSLVADALTARGIAVLDILTPTKATPHNLTSFARIEGNRVRYPGEQAGLFESST